EYNEKMCFENDAKNWDNLNNKKINYFYVGESLILRIKENGTAQQTLRSRHHRKRYIAVRQAAKERYQRLLTVFWNRQSILKHFSPIFNLCVVRKVTTKAAACICTQEWR
ncbi:MAG: hypothetical protein J6K80_01400, partial [Oscillospiraceae bacterium]|nr:hypothetical protein [Oscillospiraceae bacterium]